jgi:methionyl-tRNA formyltransferase
MRVVLASMNEIGRQAIEELVKHVEVVGLLTPRERGDHYMDLTDFTEVTDRLGVPLFKIDDINSPETEKRIRELAPDAGMSLGWKKIVKQRIFGIPKQGWIGAHPGWMLLKGERPDPAVYSAPGNEPINYAILGGFRKTGMSLFWLESRVDAGEVFARGQVEIDVEHETSDSLLHKIARLTAELLRENLPALVAGRPPRMPQEFQRDQPYTKPLRAEDNRIDPSAPIADTYRLIRSCIHPYPNAFLEFYGRRIYMERARVENGEFTELTVRTGDPR